MRNRLPLVDDYWWNMHITLSLPSFNLFENVTVYRCGVYWKQQNKEWIILFWSSCCRACFNILDSVLCSLCVVLQWEYKLFTVILDLYKVIINHWTPDGVNFLYAPHFLLVGNYWIAVKILGICGELVKIIPLYFCTHIELVNLTLPNV